MNRFLSSVVLTSMLAWVAGVSAATSAANLVVHEWGTFTSFQTRDGKTIPGINVDDEPVPPFVHRVSGLPIFTTRSTPATWSQGAPMCHPDVTLRLETPVLYFYPRAGFQPETSINVLAGFKGGWLTEFYPDADAKVPGFPERLDENTRGSLAWSGLRLQPATHPALPQTNAAVWLAPRQVRAAIVATDREAEKYLFYRGVGHLDAPFVIRQEQDRITVARRDSSDSSLLRWPPMWLARVRTDGHVWYRRVQSSEPVDLPEASAGANQLEGLRTELATELESQGLYHDEALAMLATWKLSYFESEGLRLFFLLPRPWTDGNLPLSISVPAEVTRVMMGRIELTSNAQLAALQRLHELPDSAFSIVPIYGDDRPDAAAPTQTAVRDRMHKIQVRMRDGALTHSGLYESVGRDVPEALQLYESLGRFRDAWIVQEWRSETEPVKRARLRGIISKFSACLPPPSE